MRPLGARERRGAGGMCWEVRLKRGQEEVGWRDAITWGFAKRKHVAGRAQRLRPSSLGLLPGAGLSSVKWAVVRVPERKVLLGTLPLRFRWARGSPHRSVSVQRRSRRAAGGGPAPWRRYQMGHSGHRRAGRPGGLRADQTPAEGQSSPTAPGAASVRRGCCRPLDLARRRRHGR